MWQGDSTIRQERTRMSAGERERQRLVRGYLPPRLTQAEAIQEAALSSNRHERAYQHIACAFRYPRRMSTNLIVAADTVNIADGEPQRVNRNSGALG